MTKTRPKRPRARLFVALDPATETRAALARWQVMLVEAGVGELRAPSPEQLHITLAFLGYHYEREIDAIAAAVEAVDPAVVPLAFESLPVPHPPRRPKLYAAAVGATSELTALRADLVRELEPACGFVDERRVYWPHATLCRVKSRADGHRVLAHPPPAPAELARPVPAAAITLYRSELHAAGATHTPLASVTVR